ncbi:hypothetical protein ASD54_25800 [Rhizobium sp. Root149]|uniref:hypothetical protein n=1 Tax=Rhizobium sp. Root149 TaxID=1736473 RepID=UPI0007138270|nr:hypothetical protein [Rhizobium sp. Root149]KQZ53276.1 hypothetical protein ASD54_25800 [Rhizobium sp. Root149]
MSIKSIAVFSCPGVLTPQISARWAIEGLTLIECRDISDVHRIPREERIGALLDVTLGVDQLFDLSEALERLEVAFVFIAAETEAWPGYRLRGGSARIQEIEEALLFQNDDGRRH